MMGKLGFTKLVACGLLQYAVHMKLTLSHSAGRILETRSTISNI